MKVFKYNEREFRGGGRVFRDMVFRDMYFLPGWRRRRASTGNGIL
jgi:hypothetical protein